MNYLQARRAEALFTRYRKLALDYWNAPRPAPPEDAWMAAPLRLEPEESDSSRELRRQVKILEPEVVDAADRLGVAVTGQSFPAPAVGGVVMPFNLLTCVIDQSIGHTNATKAEVLDAIDKSIGTAQVVKRRALARLLKPWCWLVDVPVMIVGWPFLVMKRAGVPKSIVESGTSQFVKAALIVALYVAAIYFGYRVGEAELLRLFLK